MLDQGIILNKYTEQFGIPEYITFAPGRANIIGEHTDYNQGYVLPFAIDKKLMFCSGSNIDERFNILANDLDEKLSFTKGEKVTSGFGRYFSSVVEVLIDEGYHIHGLNICFGGDLAIGAGISSSSAITCGFLGIINAHFDLDLSNKELLRLAVKAEHGVGVQGGAMDQFSIINGLKDKAMLIDCLDNSVEFINVDLSPYSFYLLNTNVQHNLQDTEYNTRAQTCRDSLVTLKDSFQEIKTFRDIKSDHLNILNEVAKKRLTHVIHENERVAKTIAALKLKDYKSIGRLLYESHESLRTLYEVSCEELDFLVDQLMPHDKVAGARMMGGGFGGSVICLLSSNHANEISSTIADDYENEFKRKLDLFEVQPENGLRVETYNSYIEHVDINKLD